MALLPRVDQKSCGSSASHWQTGKSSTVKDSSNPNWGGNRERVQSAKSFQNLGSRGGGFCLSFFSIRPGHAASQTRQVTVCRQYSGFFWCLVYRRISQKHPSQRRSSVPALGGSKIQRTSIGKIAPRSRFRTGPDGAMHTAGHPADHVSAVSVGNRAGARQSDHDF